MKDYLKNIDKRLFRINTILEASCSTFGDVTQGLSTASNLQVEPDGRWTIIYLQEDPLRYLANMKTICQVQVFRLLIAGLVYPEFLNLPGVGDELDRLSQGL